MDKVMDFFTSMRDRFTNPFVFSFISAWGIINWKVLLALCWIDRTKVNYETVVAIIQKEVTLESGVIIPLVLGTAMVIVLPFIKSVLMAVYAFASRLGTDWSLNLRKQGKMSVDHYIRLRKTYLERTSALVEALDSASADAKSQEEITKEIVSLTVALDSKNAEASSLRSTIIGMFDVAFLNGYWVNIYEEATEKGNVIGQEYVLIEDGKYYVLKNDVIMDKKHIFNIEDFVYNKNANSIFFSKVLVESERNKRPPIEHYNRNRLFVQDEGRTLVGTENASVKIRYIRRVSSS